MSFRTNSPIIGTVILTLQLLITGCSDSDIITGDAENPAESSASLSAFSYSSFSSTSSSAVSSYSSYSSSNITSSGESSENFAPADTVFSGVKTFPASLAPLVDIDYCETNDLESNYYFDSLGSDYLFNGYKLVKNTREFYLFGIRAKTPVSLNVRWQDFHGNQIGPMNFSLEKGRQVLAIEPRSLSEFENYHPYLGEKVVFSDSLNNPVDTSLFKMECTGYSFINSGGPVSVWGDLYTEEIIPNIFKSDSIFNSYFTPNPYYFYFFSSIDLPGYAAHTHLDSHDIEVLTSVDVGDTVLYSMYSPRYEHAYDVLMNLGELFPDLTAYKVLPRYLTTHPRIYKAPESSQIKLKTGCFNNVSSQACYNLLDSLGIQHAIPYSGYDAIVTLDQLPLLTENPWIIRIEQY